MGAGPGGYGPVCGSDVANGLDDALTREVVLQLPPSYDLLFGHPEPL
ncbi:hypothetical protein [Streptomyces sp. A0592]|nr:hypothetical protein [Streptomyces sp. A0592]